MSAHQPKHRILQEMGHHARTQAASPLSQQPKQTAPNLPDKTLMSAA